MLASLAPNYLNMTLYQTLGYEQDYKLKTIMYKYLNVTTPCGEEIYNHCSFTKFNEFEFNCTKPCLAVSYDEQFKKSNNAINDKCETLTDYKCMSGKMIDLFLDIFDTCPKCCTATGTFMSMSNNY